MRQEQSSNLGGIEWELNINGRALKVATGKSILIRVKSIWLHKAYGEFIVNDRYV